MHQVIIVGAGPTGACLALMLAQRGITVKLIEAARNFERSFRGEALMPSGLAALETMGLADIVTQIPHHPLTQWEFWIEGRSVFQVDEPMRPDEPPCTCVAQSNLLTAIIDRAKQLPNFELIQGRPVQNLLRHNHRVSGVRLNNGTEHVADLVIGSDGRNSIVRKKADLPLQAQTQNFNILWFKLPAGNLFDNRHPFCTIVQDRNAFGVFHSTDNALQVGWSVHAEDPDWKDTNWPETLRQASPPWLSQHFHQYADSISKPIPLNVIVGRCEQWHRPGVLILGDAAHPMSPVRAQGINMALRDVLVATNRLVPALRTKDTTTIDTALMEIQTERQAEIIRVQTLQAAEVHDAEKLRQFSMLRQIVSRSPAAIRHLIKTKWLFRQKKLRQGLTRLSLEN
ncbi:FAD-dependent monooxygenase [filamentous cyanobacterium LEGE 11480]|uniref:FAD-dependent monooxygenase n=1 Tax=Romeriopsis navalis LEGE 11480 TaxID=2777977 RepID=A0A928VKN6_9CYAN|nr:FAD-dependent monooxygenase [Romeriopsis navalis]MBE9030321.1 FAD-dependent monooxygenase [Romeriopsis navalis LEGE 11480]